MADRYTVHRHTHGNDEVLGHFEVRNGEIVFDSYWDQSNCDIFPPGPMAPITKLRLQSLLDNRNKTVYLTRG